MRRPFETWRRGIWLWGVPLGFCLLNLAVLVFYHTVYAGEVENLERDYGRATEELAELERDSGRIEAFLDRVEAQQQNVQHLYADHFLTEAERFTRALKEVKRLAREAGLNPTSLAYPQLQMDQSGLIQRGITFSVEGTYRQLRTFINFLELSDQFLALNGISLSESSTGQSDAKLRIRISLSTVFVEEGLMRGPAT